MIARIAAKISIGLSFLVFLVFIIVLVLEIRFRLSNKYWLEGIQYSNTEIWHWHKNLNSVAWDEESGSVLLRTDKFGFRNYGKDYTRQPNTVRILIIGDSYTAGLSYNDEKIFTSLLEQKLNALHLTNKKIEVLNMASPAWGTEQQFLCLKNYGLFAKPDYVLMMTCPNDIRETYCKKFAYLEYGEVKFNPIPFSREEIYYWKLACYSRFYQYLQKEKLGTHYGTFEMLMDKFRFNFGKEDSVSWDRPMFLKKSFPELDEAWNLYCQLVEDAKKICAENKIQFAVSSTPFVLEFDETMKIDTAMRSGRVAEKIGNYCAYAKIPYINLYPQFKNDSAPIKLFRLNDKHFNAKGHEITADALADYYKTIIRSH